VASELLEESLIEKAERLATQIVEQAQQAAPIDRLIKEIANTLSKKHQLCPRLLGAVAVAMSDPTSKNPAAAPSLRSVIRREAQWMAIFECLNSEAKWPQMKPVGDLCAKVAALLRRVASQFHDGSIELTSLHAIRENAQGFVALCHRVGGIDIDDAIVLRHHAELRKFDERLQQTSGFANFFCSCGVKIDADALRERVNRITQEQVTPARPRRPLIVAVNTDLFVHFCKRFAPRPCARLTRGFLF
jgi:hypothetical protein